jgi:charged multivesicular body protein 3
MNVIKRAIYGPDPQEQKRKCNSLIRQNQRELDKQLSNLNQMESKTKNMIKQSAKRNDVKSARVLAKEVYGIKRQRGRLHKSKAQLNSISLQVNEAFAIQKLEGSMKTSTGLMKEVNSLVRLPELMGTMNALGRELMKSGIIDEMVTDTLDNLDEAELLDDEEAEAEIDKILSDIVGEKKVEEDKEAIPSPPVSVPQEKEQVEESSDQEMLNSMRERLKALQS